MGVNFSNFIGTNENCYSKVIAQTFVLSEEFRNLFLALVNSKIKKSQVILDLNDNISEILIDSDIDGNGRLDINIKFESGKSLGIENKKWAILQKNQLQRYSDSLKKQNEPYILILLSPKHYKLPVDSEPKNLSNGEFIQINYSEIEKISLDIAHKTNDSFKKKYFENLNEYIGGLIVKPFNTNEIQSFLNYGSGIKKIYQILNDLKTDTEKIENWRNQYVLVGRMINNNYCFFGFRMDSNWYYQEALINNNPELIFYVKDIEDDANQAKLNNDSLRTFFTNQKDDIIKNYNCSVDFYNRKKNNECRLAIRKSLVDFNGKDIDKICLWFGEVLEFMNQLPEKI